MSKSYYAKFCLHCLLASFVFALGFVLPLAAEEPSTAPHILAPLSAKGITEEGISFILRALYRCNFGDLDALNYDLLASDPLPRMLLTLEPLLVKDTSVAPVVKDISGPKGLYQEGFHTKLPLPVLSKPTLLGLFICKDSNKEAHCNNKAVVPINEILSKYSKEKDKPESKPGLAVDKVYFFKFLVFDGKGGVFYPAKEINQQTYSQLETELLGLGIVREQLTPVMERLRVIHEALGSVNLVAGADGSLGIILPKYSQEKCG